jgi:hypothetical protein
MQFEKVHTIRDIYDGIRSGTADLSGAPHYFASLFDDKMDDYTQHFRLYAVSAQFMEREPRHWAVYRTWEAKFHRGLEPLETHPGHGGIVPEYDELSEWLNEQIKALMSTRPSIPCSRFLHCLWSALAVFWIGARRRFFVFGDRG